MNVPPTLGGAGGTLAFVEGDGASVIDSTLGVVEPDDTHIESATVSISSGLSTAEDELSLTGSHLSLSQGAALSTPGVAYRLALAADGNSAYVVDHTIPTQEQVAQWPATFIKWSGAHAFASFYGISLPTAAQWEYAAKGGQDLNFPSDDGTMDATKANCNETNSHPDLGLVVFGMAVFPFHFLALDVIFARAVPRAVLLGFSPSQETESAMPERQVEGHTCGLHAMRAIYAAHQLPPDDHGLRFRLGIDRAAVPRMGSTQGALQPDICRVLAQDGFQVSMVNLSVPDLVSQVGRHLSRTWKGLVLIRKTSNGNLHWIDLERGEGAFVHLIDSQKETLRRLPWMNSFKSRS